MLARRTILIGLLLGALIHADWHFARPGHLGMNWRYHWVGTALLFGVIGWAIARRWPADRWLIAALSLVAGVIVGQLLEPMYEAGWYQHRFGFDLSAARWLAFGQAIGAGTLLYITGVWFGTRRSRARL